MRQPDSLPKLVDNLSEGASVVVFGPVLHLHLLVTAEGIYSGGEQLVTVCIGHSYLTAIRKTCGRVVRVSNGAFCLFMQRKR